MAGSWSEVALLNLSSRGHPTNGDGLVSQLSPGRKAAHKSFPGCQSSCAGALNRYATVQHLVKGGQKLDPELQNLVLEAARNFRSTWNLRSSLAAAPQWETALVVNLIAKAKINRIIAVTLLLP